jgi:hypothetical protein
MVLTLSSERGWIGMAYNLLPPSRLTSRRTLKQFGTHIFYAEGEKTEPKYINDMKMVIQNRYKMTASDMIIVDTKSGGKNTLGLIKYAEKDVTRRIANKERIDHVWIFYDKDSFEPDKYDNSFHKVVSKNKKKYLNEDHDNCDKNYTRWHALWSNECFELWILLHFEYCQASLRRESYIPKIDQHFKKCGCSINYEKNLSNLYQILEKHGSIRSAVRNAKKLNDELNNPLLKTNPSTGVFELFEYFHKYLQIEI